MKRVVALLLPMGLLACAGCAGFRRGVFSMPYPEGNRPRFAKASTPFRRREMAKVDFPGCVLTIDLRNDIQTSHTAWMCVVPLHLDFEDSWKYGRQAGGFQIKLTFRSTIDGLSFEPLGTTLTIDGEPHTPASAGRSAECRESVEPVPTVVSIPRGKYYSLYLHFETEKPSPDKNIELDIRKAVRHPKGAPLPLIKFRKTRYVHGYT